MGLGQSIDLDCYEKGKKKMEFAQSKDLDCFKKGQKPWGFGLG